MKTTLTAAELDLIKVYLVLVCLKYLPCPCTRCFTFNIFLLLASVEFTAENIGVKKRKRTLQNDSVQRAFSFFFMS